MDMIPWSPLFETGHSTIDQQHKTLFQLTNDLAHAIRTPERCSELSHLVDRLRAYASDQFSKEELLIRGSRLSKRQQTKHAYAHRSFIDKMDELAKAPKLSNADTADALLRFLLTWLATHILTLDRTIAMDLLASDTDTTSDSLTIEQVLVSALIETDQRFRHLSDAAPTLIWTCGVSGEREFSNKAWLDLSGIPDNQQNSVDWFRHIHPDDIERYSDLIRILISSTQSAEVDYRFLLPCGSWSLISESIRPRLNGDRCIGLIAIGCNNRSKQFGSAVNVTNDPSVLNDRTSELARLALIDPLTGLANRRMLMERLDSDLSHAHRDGTPLSTLFIDVDHFKNVNDNYGHGAGDSTLTTIGTILRSNIRATDLAGRIGGEEFVVILKCVSAADAFRIADTIRDTISQTSFERIPVPITVSIGIATMILGDNSETLLGRADNALLSAKRHGRNRCEFGYTEHETVRPLEKQRIG